MKTRIAIVFSLVGIFACVNTLHAQLKFADNGQKINYYLGISVTTGDFNGDGITDAFVKNSGNYRVYFGEGHGLFTASSQVIPNEGYSYDKPATGDINDDGFLEIIAKNIVLHNDGHGKFTPDSTMIEIPDNIELEQPQLTDLNGDKALDLVTIENNGGMRVFYNDGKGHFTDSGQKLCDSILKGSIMAHIAMGDVNGDGYYDIVSAGWIMNGSTVCPNRVWFGDSLGNFLDSGQLLDEGDSHVHGLKLGDLNKDGFLDIVMLFGDDTRAGRIYLNDGTGHFTAGANIPGNTGESAAICDFDGNGTQDIFVAQGTTPSRVWLSDGTGQIHDSGVKLGSHCYFDVAAGDFNSDGKMDAFTVGYIATSGASAYAQIWLNSSTTGIGQVEEQKMVLFPNPTSGQFFISFGNAVKQTLVEITNLQGIPLFSKSFQNTATAIIDLTNYSSGVYIVKVIENGTSQDQKIVKE